jgi:pimeloyl-ACP methyl ester carboxylesterase
MPHVETEQGNLFYTLNSAAPGCLALVLIHGAGGTHLHWPVELRRLAGASVYTLDLPGHGRSAGDGCDTIGGYARAVAAFLRAVDTGPVIVVGHSMGGAIAMTLALDFDGVIGAVLVGTGARLRVTPAILEGIHSDFERSVEIITRFAWSQGALPGLLELGKQALLDTGPDVLQGDFSACDRFDVMERLEKMQVPTLVISSSADQLTPVKYGQFLAEHIPNARLVVIENAGHMMMLERPNEVAEAMRKYLEESFSS